MSVTIILFLTGLIAVASLASEPSSSESLSEYPCTEYTNMIMNNGLRSSDFDSTKVDLPICDANIPQNTWYRFDDDSGTLLIETPVPPWRCGTQAPIWMNGTHPITDQQTTATVCAVFSDSNNCQWNATITIQMCNVTGDSFFVYKLAVPPGCPLAYCVDAASRKECLPPLIWINDEFRCGEYVTGTTRAPTTTPAAPETTTVALTTPTPPPDADGWFPVKMQRLLLTPSMTCASSIWLGQSVQESGLSEYAVDGIYESDWRIHPCFHTDDQPGGPNWLAVDLGESVRLAQVVLLNRKDDSPNRLDNFIVGVTDEKPSNETDMRDKYHLCGTFKGSVQAGAFAVVACDKDTPKGRYLVIQQPADGPGYLTICEMEAWVYLPIPQPPYEEKLRDCKDIFSKIIGSISKVYRVYPECNTPIDVFCDMETTGGPWTVFQRRINGTIDFFRNWNNYSDGFGDLNGEFWLGNENLRLLMVVGRYKLRIEMSDFEGEKRYAEYSSFAVSSSSDNYRLNVSGYSGDAGDSFASYHTGQQFSTKDADHDAASSLNCAEERRGGWWYNNCHQINPNGLYLHGAYTTTPRAGLEWRLFRGDYYSLKTIEMKMNRID